MAQSLFARKIALRYLLSRRAEAFVSIITISSIVGVAIGVMVLTVVMSVMTGFQQTLREKILTTNAHVTVRSMTGLLEGWRSVASEISQLPQVASVSAFTYQQVHLRVGDRSSGLLLRGVDPSSEAARQVAAYVGAASDPTELFGSAAANSDLEAGGSQGTSSDTSPSEATQEPEALLPALVIGRQLANMLGVLAGDTISVVAPSVGSTPFGLMPRFRRFRVSAIYSSGLQEYENSVAYIALADAQRFFRLGDPTLGGSVNGLELRVHDIERAAAVARQVVTNFPGLLATDWGESNRPLWDAIRLEKRVYFIVLLLIIVMASFSIVSTLVLMVMEKRKDIAIMKTMGATSATIGRIFRLQGAVIGACGTLLGLLLGVLACLILDRYGFPIDERIFQMSKLPVHIDVFNLILTGVSAFLICYFATIYPARRASRLEPADVLRYE
jgi:lipoprotein-releasing system permease protein